MARVHHGVPMSVSSLRHRPSALRAPCPTLSVHIVSHKQQPVFHTQPLVSSRSFYASPPYSRASQIPVRASSQAHTTPQGAPSQITLTGSCYEDIISSLSLRAIQAASTLTAPHKHIIGIAGAPGSVNCNQFGLTHRAPLSAHLGQARERLLNTDQCDITLAPGFGKSTLASAVKEEINKQLGTDAAVLLPMDGFHYYRAELDAMPDPKQARARRGAHWTFNAPRLVEVMQRVRDQGQALVPSFDHGVGDPVEDDIAIEPHHRIVLVEGLYVLMDMEPWKQLKPLFDDTWFVDVDIDVAMDRVYRRQTSLGITHEVSKGRISGNDRPNGELVNSTSRNQAAVLVPSSIPFSSSSLK